LPICWAVIRADYQERCHQWEEEEEAEEKEERETQEAGTRPFPQGGVVGPLQEKLLAVLGPRRIPRVIRRTQNPALCAELEEMLHCPIRDARGNCRSFTDHILSSLIKNGVHARFDLEAALAYVVEKMLMERREKGEPRLTLFGGFQERPGYLGGNPLQARFHRPGPQPGW
jgi:hypothetical protein